MKKEKDLEGFCKRCGKCCWYRGHGGEMKPCPHLIPIPENGTTACDIYPNRLGAHVAFVKGEEITCHTTEEAVRLAHHPVDCPYFFYYAVRAEKLNLARDQITLLQQVAFQIANHACETGDWSRIYPGPKSNCNHCYGRGYEGRNVSQKGKEFYVLCRCVNR